MLQDILIDFIDALMIFFEDKDDLYKKLLLYRHEIKNRLNNEQIMFMFNSFIDFSVYKQIEENNPFFLKNTFLEKDMDEIWNMSSEETKKIIWKWFNVIKNVTKCID